MNNALDEFLNKKSKNVDIYRDRIHYMLNDIENSWSYAESTLVGILDYIEENNSISEKQMEAVDNIFEKPSYGR